MISLTEARRHSPLFRNLVRREVRQRYKASAFGLLWTLINPAVVVLSYWFVFQFVFRTDANDPYALFLFVGLSVWTVFMSGVQSAASSLVANANLVTKVKFPRQIVPLSAMTGAWVTAAAMFAIAIPLCAIAGKGSKLTWLAVPPLLVLLACLTVGCGLLLAATNVYFRDVEHILAALAIPWFFLTPVLFSFDMLSVGENTWPLTILHYANFVSPFVLSIRGALFNGLWPTTVDLVYCTVAAFVFLAIGWAVFRRLEREMAVEL